MPPQKENQRIRLTKRMLKDSLLHLLESKPLEKITIRELCAHAEVNRSTFYANYRDIYQLFQEMCEEFTDELESYVYETKNEFGDLPSVQRMLEYIKEHERLCTLLLYGTDLVNGHNPIQKKVTSLTLRHISSLFPHIDPQYRDYLLRYCYTGSNALIAQWIENRFDLSVEVLAKMSIDFSRQIVEFALSGSGKGEG